MYLKTPKRYRKHQTYYFSFKHWWLWLLTLTVCVVGWRVWLERETLAPLVGGYAEVALSQAGEQVATLTAPTPLPTADPYITLAVAHQHWNSGRVEQALDMYADLLPAVPNDPLPHYNYTRALIVEGRYEEALIAAENTVTASPFNSDAWAVRAEAHLAVEDAGGAIASALNALALYPDNVYAVALLGQAYLALERTEKARETAERALALDPNSPEAWYLLARVRRLVDFDLEGAAEDFRTAYDLAPNRLDIAVELAYVYWSMQDYDAGIALLTGIIDNNPNNTQALYAAGFIYNSGIGSPQLASEPLQQCITVDDQNIDCLYYYGRVLLRLEQSADAAEVLTRAVELGTQVAKPNPRHYYWAAQAYINLGNCPLAMTYLEPGYELAQQQDDAELTSALADSVRQCSGFGDLAPVATPEATPAIEGEANDL